MRPIYLAAFKGSTTLIDENLKYVIVKEDEVTILNKKQYIPDPSHILTLMIDKSNTKFLKKYIKEHKENLDPNSPDRFVKLLKEKFDIEKQQEQVNQDKLLSQDTNAQKTELLNEEDRDLLNSISQDPNLTALWLRPKSVGYGIEKTETMRKAYSHAQMAINPEVNSSMSESTSSLHQQSSSLEIASSNLSINSQGSFENANRTQLNFNKMHLFFTVKENNNNLDAMEKHGVNIKNSYFNGNEKSEILLSITQLATKMRNNTNSIGNESDEQKTLLKENITQLNKIINNKHNLETLSHYRGFSALKCFASLWGGGKVKSIEYVEKLRKQIGSLTQELSSLRPSV